MEPLCWRLAAGLQHIPSGADGGGLIGKLCAGAGGSTLLWQRPGERSSTETSGPNYTTAIGEHVHQWRTSDPKSTNNSKKHFLM